MDGGTLVIAIAGKSASGKSLYAANIAEAFTSRGISATVLHCDDFYKELADPSMGPDHNWDHPDAFDYARLGRTIQSLTCGNMQWLPKYDYSQYKYTDTGGYYARASQVLIVEGILSYYDPSAIPRGACRIYMSCHSKTAMVRRIARDQVERGYGYQDIVDRYKKYVVPCYEQYIRPLRKRAHYIVDNSADDPTAAPRFAAEIVEDLCATVGF